MIDNNLKKISELISDNKIDNAQIELSKLGSSYYKNSEYLYLRSKVFYFNKLYYIAIDTLLIALEFDQNDKIFNLISEIYNTIDNRELSEKILDPKIRLSTINLLKDELSGIYRKNH